MLNNVINIILEGSVELTAFAVEKKGLFIGLVTIGFLALIAVIFHPYDVDYPKGTMTPEYQKNLAYLLEAAQDRVPDILESVNVHSGRYLPIVDDKDFPQLAKKLRQMYQSSQNQFIVLGGMSVIDIDQPLLRAVKGLPRLERSRIYMIIVSPATISSTTERILEEKNVKVELL